MDIVYYSDYACPYCYIGETNLKKALDELGLLDETTITMKAFELDPHASKEDTGDTVNRFAQKYEITPEQAQERVDSISQMSRDSGIGFDYAKTHYTNTFDAHRLTKLAQSKEDPNIADTLSENLYKAYFVDGKALADPETLVQYGVDSGLEEDEIRSLLDSDQYAVEVLRNEIEANQLGVHAVPFFVIDNKYGIPGALPVDGMKNALEIITKEDNIDS